jgi:hypothetical protein
MPRAGFEPAIPATKRPQTYVLDRAATGIGHLNIGYMRTQSFMVPRWLVQYLHPPQKFQSLPFLNGRSYRIRNNGIEVTFSGMILLRNFMYHWFQSIWGGGGSHRQADTQAGRWSHKLTSSNKNVSELKNKDRFKTERFVAYTYLQFWSSFL